MANNDEKILPILRLLLITFFGLLLVVALQLVLLVTRTRATATAVRVVYAQLTSSTPFWNIAENKIDWQTGLRSIRFTSVDEAG